MSRHVATLVALLTAAVAQADVITRFPTRERAIALTFDACESRTRVQFESTLLSELHDLGVPFTVFLTGKFVRDNEARVRELAVDPMVEFENHSFSHFQDMRRLSAGQLNDEIARASAVIAAATGTRPRFFRFPAGRHDARTVALAEQAGLHVVHWSFPSGDPDPKLTAKAIVDDTLSRVRPGDILIFHINGRGVHTSELMPGLVMALRARGYRFLRLDDALGLAPSGRDGDSATGRDPPARRRTPSP